MYGEYLTEQSNFETFLLALLTLFRCSTGESWNGIWHDIDGTSPDLPGVCYAKNSATGKYFCEEEGQGAGCAEQECSMQGSPAVPAFFMTFTVVVSFIFLNMFIAVILDNFSGQDSDDAEEEGFPIKLSNIQQYVSLACTYHSHRMPVPHFCLSFARLPALSQIS